MKKLPLVLIAVLLLAMPFPAAGSSRLAAPPLLPGEYIVDILGDTGGQCPSAAAKCSLRTAIETANSDGINSSITFAVSGTIELGSSLPAVTDTHPLTITGPVDGITISGEGLYKILSVESGAVLTLNNLTISNGFNPGDGGALTNSGSLALNTCEFRDNLTTGVGRGGAIENTGVLNIDQCDFVGNEAAGNGGAIHNNTSGMLTIHTSTFVNNQAAWFGGAIHNEASSGPGIITANISESTFQGNHATLCGGAIANIPIAGQANVNLSVSQSLFRDNTADEDGGAIYHSSKITTVINSTLTGNSAARGGAIFNAVGWYVYLINNTIVNNTATDLDPEPDPENPQIEPIGWNIHNDTGFTYIRNTIVTSSLSSAHNCHVGISGSGEIKTKNDGNNIDNGASCRFGSDNGSHSNTNPQLLDLADNGGPTLTMALRFISPAVDGVTVPHIYDGSIDCPSVDQRGVSRPILGKPLGTPRCDIGAYEFEPPTWLFVFLPLITR